jgi:predicted RNase H-like HicB family nuclease
VKVRDVIRLVEQDGWRTVVTFKHPGKPGRVAKGNAGLRTATGGHQARDAMSKLQYLVRINKDPDSDWGASVPDLPGCVATGKTIDQTLRRIERALALRIRGLLKDSLTPPRPRHRSVTPMRTRRQVDFFATIEVAA